MRKKLFLAYFLPVSCILFITAMLTYRVIDGMVWSSAREKMGRFTDTVVQSIEKSLDLSIRNYLRGIAEVNKDAVSRLYERSMKGELSEAEAKQMAGKALLSQRIGVSGYIFVWDISNSPSEIVLAVHPYIQGQNVAHVDFVQEGARIKTGYIKYKWKNPADSISREKVMYLSYFEPWNWVIAVSSYKEEFTSLVSVVDFKQTIRNISFGESGYFYVINSKGDVIAHPGRSGNMLNDLDAKKKPFIREICERKNGEVEYYIKAGGASFPERQVSFFKYLPDFDWILVSSSYTGEFRQTLANVGWITLFTVILLVFVVYAVTHFAGTSILNNLNALIGKFKEVEEGDYSANLSVDTQDEFSELAKHFNRFMEQIRVSRADLISVHTYLTNVINSLPSLLVAVDADRRIQLWNKKSEDFTGKLAEEALGENFFNVLPFLSFFQEVIDRAIEMRTSVAFNHTARSTEEGARDFRVSVFPFHQEEKNVALIRIDEVTEEARKDAQLIQAQKMEIVGNLAGGLAHDFNNILAGIIGTVSLMKRNLGTEKDDSKNGKYILTLESSARRAADIVNRLLTLSKDFEPDLKPTDLNDCMRNVIAICRNSFDKSIEIETSYLPEPAIIHAASGQIEQVLLNICVNSAHAMTVMRSKEQPKGGKLSVAT